MMHLPFAFFAFCFEANYLKADWTGLLSDTTACCADF
jgi:hypothetical protein